MTLQPGQVLKDRYEIVGVLGEGGMGRVYRAKDTLAMDLFELAVKELKIEDFVADEERTIPKSGNAGDEAEFTLPHVSGEINIQIYPEGGGENTIPRQHPLPHSSSGQTFAESQFKTEARLLHYLNHPNLPKVHDYFRDGDDLYLVMDLIEGQDLEDVLEEAGDKRLDAKRILEWTSQVMDALRYCHQSGVFHRDVKPENIILTDLGRVYLVDFGIAGRRQSEAAPTVGGGTVGFCPPEQWDRLTFDARSDVYALGATLYRLFTRETPQDARERVIEEHLITPVEINPNIEPRISNCIMKALCLDPKGRFSSILEFQHALGLIPGDFKPPSIYEVFPGDDLPAIARSASKGAVIRLHGGRYPIKDTLVINQDLSLEAVDDTRPEIACGRTLHVACFKNGNWKISGIDFIHTGTFSADVVMVNGKAIEIDDCTFTGGILDVKKQDGSGLVIRGNTNGVVRRSRFLQNGYRGVSILDHAIVHLVDNVCENNQRAGIALNGKARGYVGSNRCANNGYPGISIQDTAQADIEDNTCEANEYSGISVRSQGEVFVSNNICRKNEKSGITVSGKAEPKIEFNTCELNKEFGIMFTENARGQASKNTCHGNHKSGIGVMEKADPDLSRNLCEQNRECGLYFSGHGGGNIWKNECRKNRSHGIELAGLAAPYLEGNQFLENGEHGISVGKDAVPVQINNTSKGNGRGDSIHYQ